jgi:SpoVK/Ycf46/Vps4 family AAA+-type ATPase
VSRRSEFFKANHETNMAGYSSSVEHLLEELQRIDLLVRLQIRRFRMLGRAGQDDFRGLYIKEEEIDALLADEVPFRATGGIEPPQLDPLLDQLSALECQIADKKVITLRSGAVLRLERLKELFQLSSFDVDALLICLAPELDLKYEKLHAYLQDDVTKKRPTVELVLALLCPTFEGKLVARERLTPTTPLVRHRLLNVFPEMPERHPPLLAQFLKADERIVQFLLGSDQTDPRLLPFVRPGELQVSWRDLILPEDVKSRLRQIARWYWETRVHAPSSNGRADGIIFYFHGPAGVGKQATAEALCDDLGMALLRVDVARMLQGELPFESAARLIFRETLLQQTALYFDRFDLLLAEDDKIRQCREILTEELERLSGLIFLAGQTSWEPAGAFHHKTFIRVEFPLPSYAIRKQLWEISLNGLAPANFDLDALANKFQLSPGQIRDAVATAENLAFWRDPQRGQLTGDDLYSACRAHSNQKLSTLARKIPLQYTWRDIVLPKEQMAQLYELVNHMKYRHLVYSEWGFERKLSLGKGLNVLFAGPSGTGKTMAAEVLAHELSLDLYKIDLSQVVSKYIGETEKNLDRIFREAQTSNAILFFDEADALFGKRSEVKDAHDRYANIETGYLLQKMEEYEGVAILATNLRANLDEAFARRMHFVVEFPFPDEEYRYHIWQGIFPPQAPLADDVDFATLARSFKLSGGNIKNIALAAAFLAAEEGQPIGMRYLLRSVRRELQKVGQAWEEAAGRS